MQDISTHYRKVNQSQTLLLNEQSRLLETEGKDIFKFGFGQSPFPPLQAATDELKKHAGAKDYSAVQGIPLLRTRIADFHHVAEGIDITEDRVLVGPGSKILIYTVMAMFKNADILIPVPSWVSYTPQAILAGHTPIPVQSTFNEKWRITGPAIERAIKAKNNAQTPSILIFNYPGNPDGLTYSEDELKEIAHICQHHRILVIADEIYGLLHHKGEHRSFAHYYPEATIVTGGLSKWCGAGGWRIGMAMLPESLNGEFKRNVLGIASETYSCTALPVQMAACAAYQWNEATQKYLSHQRRLLSFIGNWTASKLKAAGVQVHMPEGGFYLFLDFSPFVERLERAGITTSQMFCEKLLAETGVALLPGDAFGLPPNHISARLAYVEFDGQDALTASEQIDLNSSLNQNLLHTVFAKTTRGIALLCGWLNAF